VQEEASQTFTRLTGERRCDEMRRAPTPQAEVPPNTLQTGRCAARNKQGNPCAAPALKGAELCLAHSGQTRLDSAKGAQRSAEVRRAKAEARRETLRDKLARKLEEHADEVVAAYLAGIRSDDPNRAYRAADAWISRVHGRPKETIETQLPALDDPLDIASMSCEQRDALKRKLLAQHPHLADVLGLDTGSLSVADVSATVLTAATPGGRGSKAACPVPPRRARAARDPNRDVRASERNMCRTVVSASLIWRLPSGGSVNAQLAVSGAATFGRAASSRTYAPTGL
jgi:hypothetical protein